MTEHTTEQMPEEIYAEYLKVANGESDPWKRTELRNSAHTVKAVLLRFFEDRRRPQAKDTTR